MGNLEMGHGEGRNELCFQEIFEVANLGGNYPSSGQRCEMSVCAHEVCVCVCVHVLRVLSMKNWCFICLTFRIN